MTFDILEYSDEELEKLTTIQMQLLRTAQKSKNELTHNLEKNLEMFKMQIMGNGTSNMDLYELKRRELQAEYDYRVDILKEQLIYSMGLNEPVPDADSDQEKVGYIVDYSLSYTDRYNIVRAYYLSIENPVERMNLYANDEVAKRYLANYYATLYNVLSMYSQ